MGFEKLYRPLIIKSGTKVYHLKIYTLSATPIGVAAVTVAEETFTVTGLDATYDKIIAVNPPGVANKTGIAGARVSAANTIAISFINPGAATGTPKAGDYTVIAIRKAA